MKKLSNKPKAEKKYKEKKKDKKKNQKDIKKPMRIEIWSGRVYFIMIFH